MGLTKEKHKDELWMERIPQGLRPFIEQIVQSYPLYIKIVRPRKTKLGDMRFLSENKRYIISLNGDLNAHSFLITLLHELAHVISFDRFGPKIKGHGIEWKNAFKELLHVVLDKNILPTDVHYAVLGTVNNPKASSCTDPVLFKVLQSYNENNNLVHLDDVQNGIHFDFNGVAYIKKETRRTRVLCCRKSDGKLFLIHKIAEVQTT